MAPFYAAVARHRVRILAGSLALSIAVGVALQTVAAGEYWTELSALVLLVSVGLFLLQVPAGVRYRPVTLRRSAGSAGVETPAPPSPTLFAVAVTLFHGSLLLAEEVGDHLRAGPATTADVGIGLLHLLLPVLCWYVALAPLVVRLRPDGVLNRLPWGSVFVPWEAFTADGVSSVGNLVQLVPARPEQVRRAGLGWRRDRVTLLSGNDADHLADLIREYADDPGLRAAIGTEAELARVSP